MARTRSTERALACFIASIALAIGGITLTAAPANAADLGTASTEIDLANLITAANADTAADMITLTGSGFTLTADLPVITESLTIVGPGSSTFTLDAANYDAFSATGPIDLTISGITVLHAGITSTSAGAVMSAYADTTLDDIVVIDSYVGVIALSGTLTMTNSTITGSSGYTSIFLVLDSPGSSLDGVKADSNDSGMVAILTDTGGLTLTDVDLNDNTFTGFELHQEDQSTFTSTGLTASRNGIGCGCEGIFTTLEDDATASFTTTTASQNGDEGIGVYLNNRSVATITNTTTEQNADDGIEAEASKHASLTFTNTVANGNDGDGMDVAAYTGAEITISGLVADDSADSGLEILSRGAGSLVSAASVASTSSGQDGVGFEVILGGSATLSDSTVAKSVERGIVIDNEAQDSTDSAITISRTTVRDNGGGSKNGGGIAIVQTHNLVTTIENTTISGNRGSQGGGIYARYATDPGSSLTVVNSTISGNSAEIGGGAYLRSNAGAQVAVLNTTITDNTTSGARPSQAAVYLQGTVNDIRNSIIAANAVSDLDLEQGTAASIAYSLVQAAGAEAATALSGGTGNLVGVDPMLEPLADNGGITLTHLPRSGSPAVEAGDPAFAGLSDDQRGETRVVDRLDMGAVELQPALAVTGAAAGPQIIGGALAIILGILLVVARRKRMASLG